MKVTVNACGDVILDVSNGDGQAALDLIHALQADARKKKDSEAHSTTMKESRTIVGDSGLNKIQYRTWEYLCEQDRTDGIHVSAVAQSFGISTPAANTRLIVLVKMGYAKRVHRGYYRAMTGPE